jgi:multiple sugar transport system permease protein
LTAAQAATERAGTATPAAAAPRRRPEPGWRRGLAALPWVGPATVLIGAVIAYPAVQMVVTSFLEIDSIGVSHGFTGLENYRRLLAEPALGSVVWQTVLWVVLVVGVTVLLSLALAQLLDKRFAGRRLVRWALIVPWAAALVMTATVWRFLYEGSFGLLNRLLMDLGVLDAPREWYRDPGTAFWCLVAVGVIVSLPFTTYVFLAGLQVIPPDVHEAARIDGATGWQAYRLVTLPLLRPAMVVAVVLNAIYVFNSFPIIWVITGDQPGHATDTTITFAYKIAFREQLDTGEAAALSVLNVLFLLAVVLVYLRTVPWRSSDDETEAAAPARPRARLARGRVEAGEAVARALAPVRRAGRAVLGPPGRAVARGWRAVRPVGLSLAGLAVAVFFLAPYAVMFLSSVKTDGDLFRSPAGYLPSSWQWANWVDVWDTVPLAAYLRVSLVIAVASTLVVLLVSVPAAYFAARRRFPGRTAFLYLVLVTQMFAPVALVVGLYRQFVEVGGVNQYWAIVAVNAAFNLAFAVWILTGFFGSVPREIEEAGMLDGLGRLGVLFRLLLPVAKPGLVTAVVFTFIQVWNEFVVALTLFNDPATQRQTLTVGIQQFVGLYQTQYQYLFVASLIAIVPVVVLFAAIERHLVGGLTAGSVR